MKKIIIKLFFKETELSKKKKTNGKTEITKNELISFENYSFS